MSMATKEDRQHAEHIVSKFEEPGRPQAFTKAHRLEIAEGLKKRLARPHLINQHRVGICGPTDIVYSLCFHRPVDYVHLVTNLFEHGHAKVGHWRLEPCSTLKHHDMPSPGIIEAVDWIPTASIRDCENWFFDYYSTSQKHESGMTHREMADIFSKAGFQHVHDSVQDGHLRDLHNIQKANHYFRNDYNVCLDVDSNLLKHQPPRGHHNHWIVLTSEVSIDSNGMMTAEVFSWAKTYQLHDVFHKRRKLTTEEFLEYYYGYVVCKM
jgi:hypothetical protein